MRLQPEEIRRRVAPLFQENFDRLGELGAAVSIWQHEQPLLDLIGGFCDKGREQPWASETLVLIWSATKGLASACLLHALQKNHIDLQRRVAEFWPEFAQRGKETITLGQLLSHQAGLCALDRQVDILDYDGVIRALEQQQPLWSPGTAHGYHARTFGFLLDELVRRLTGTQLAKYWRTVFANPLSLDIWIGLPQSQEHRVATMYAAKAGQAAEPQQFYRDLATPATPATLARKVFTSPAGLHAVSDMNQSKVRRRGTVSFGAIATAGSLAKFYAMLANNGVWQGQEFFKSGTVSWMKASLSDGIDRVFGIPTAFSAGFMKDSAQCAARIFGAATTAFGHPGAGGSHAFADPENGISFAYVMNQMQQSVFPNARSLRLLQALYD